MHEFGLTEGLIEAVERRAQGREVLAVKVRAGVLRRISQPSLESAFELLSQGTVAAGATVQMETVPLRVECKECGKESEIDDLATACPACGAVSLDIVTGDEWILESITVPEGSDHHVLGHSG